MLAPPYATDLLIAERALRCAELAPWYHMLRHTAMLHVLHGDPAFGRTRTRGSSAGSRAVPAPPVSGVLGASAAQGDRNNRIQAKVV
jgi:hypothetical protein